MNKTKLHDDILSFLIEVLLPRNRDSFLEFCIGKYIDLDKNIIEINVFDQIKYDPIEPIMFDVIIPKINSLLLKTGLETSMLVTNDRRSMYQILLMKRIRRKLEIEWGWHYTQEKNIKNILKHGIVPQYVNRLNWVQSVWSEYEIQMGLWTGKRSYFFLERDDEDAQMTFGPGLIPIKVNLKGISLWYDASYIDDEDSSVAAWTQEVIEPFRLII